jgi:hypothetical protein
MSENAGKLQTRDWGLNGIMENKVRIILARAVSFRQSLYTHIIFSQYPDNAPDIRFVIPSVPLTDGTRPSSEAK